MGRSYWPRNKRRGIGHCSVNLELFNNCRVVRGRQCESHIQAATRNWWLEKRSSGKIPSKRKAEKQGEPFSTGGSKKRISHASFYSSLGRICFHTRGDGIPVLRPTSSHSSESRKRTCSYQLLHEVDKPRTKKHAAQKNVRTGKQHVVWKALDLVSSSPFS